MAGCNLTQQNYDTVASVLRDPDTPLRELDLSRNVLLTKVHESLLPGLKRLENLNISHISLGRSGASILRAVLMDPESQLHTLKWGLPRITDHKTHWNERHVNITMLQYSSYQNSHISDLSYKPVSQKCGSETLNKNRMWRFAIHNKPIFRTINKSNDETGESFWVLKIF